MAEKTTHVLVAGRHKDNKALHHHASVNGLAHAGAA